MSKVNDIPDALGMFGCMIIWVAAVSFSAFLFFYYS